MQMPRPTTTMLLAGLLSLAGGAAQAQSCKPTIPDNLLVKPGFLTMATSPTLPPMQYVDQTGELKGMRIELGAEIAKRLCLTPDYIRTEYVTMIPGLQGRRWDLINAGIFVTPERRKVVHMIPYEDLAISISTANKDAGKITKPEDLAGKSVAVDLGGYSERKTKELDAELRQKGLPGLTIRTFDSFGNAFQALKAGQVEAVVSIDPVGKEYADRGEFARVLSGLYPTPGSLAFKDRQLAEKIVAVLSEMKADGSFKALLTKYGVEPAHDLFEIVGPEKR